MPDKSDAKVFVSVLKGILAYHERLLMTGNKEENASCWHCRCYRDALKEAIRCICKVHQLEDDQ